MKKALLILSAVSLGLTAATTWAIGPRGPGGPGQGGMAIHALLQNPALAENIGVTDKELDQVKSAVRDSRKRMIPLKADRDLARVELESLMDQDAPREAAVLAAVDQMGAIETAIKKEHVKTQLKVKNILGQDKLDALKAYQAEHMQKRKGKHQRGRRGPGFDRDSDQQPPWMSDENPEQYDE